eukprot:9429793-Pyramimonas_sp.AAC.1
MSPNGPKWPLKLASEPCASRRAGRLRVGAAWKASGVPREELFIATKLSADSYGEMAARVQ